MVRAERAAVGAVLFMILGAYMAAAWLWGRLRAGFLACEASGEAFNDYWIEGAARDAVRREG